jgi:hypothetical protein
VWSSVRTHTITAEAWNTCPHPEQNFCKDPIPGNPCNCETFAVFDYWYEWMNTCLYFIVCCVLIAAYFYFQRGLKSRFEDCEMTDFQRNFKVLMFTFVAIYLFDMIFVLFKGHWKVLFASSFERFILEIIFLPLGQILMLFAIFLLHSKNFGARDQSLF